VPDTKPRRGERPVTIDLIGWAVGKGKQRRFAIQTVSGAYTHRCPIEVLHGKRADFRVSLQALQGTPNWLKDFAVAFVRDFSSKSLNALVAQF